MPHDFLIMDAMQDMAREPFLGPGGSLSLSVSGAYYDKISAHIPEVSKPVDWWVRRPFQLVGEASGDLLLRKVLKLWNIPANSVGETSPRVEPTLQVFSRPVPGEDDPELRLVTVVVLNSAAGTGAGSTLFQMSFSATAVSPLEIEPYPEVDQSDRGDEEQSIDLLYRNKRTYAIGHGCAAAWGDAEEGISGRCVGLRKPAAAFPLAALLPWAQLWHLGLGVVGKLRSFLC